MKQLAKAVLAVMDEVKNIEKGMTVGSGQMSYKGVSDKDVKLKVGQAMQKHGLCLLPISVEDEMRIDRWEETNSYGTKQKQSVFVSVRTRYMLLHESGESMEIAGYGHGTDPQDKAAGKATTYALKYALLYTFLVPTGDIDDADKTHSEQHVTPPAAPAPKPTAPKVKPTLTPEDEKTWAVAIRKLADGTTTIEKIKAAYTLSDHHEGMLNLAKDLQE
jgi:hypothetical protein